MTHIHIPDAAVPGRVALAGYILMAAVLAICLWSIRKRDARRSTALTGIIGAFMMIAMSVPLGPLPVHLNLAAVAGIILGPAMAFLCVFSVNLILALVGHGGITVVGLNTIVLGVQAVTGGGLFSLLYKRRGAGLPAALSTMVAIVLSLVVVIAAFSATGLDERALIHDHGHGPEAEVFEPREHHENEGAAVRRIIAYVGPIGLAGAVIESLVVAAIVVFLERVRPDLLRRTTQ